MDRRKVLAIVAVISLIAGCCLVMILYPVLKGEDIFHPEPAPEDIGNAFLNALKEEDYTAAFELCDYFLRQELIDPANLQFEIETNQFQPERWEIQSLSHSTNEVELSGTIDFRQHPNGTFELTLRRSEDTWKIATFHLDYN